MDSSLVELLAPSEVLTKSRLRAPQKCEWLSHEVRVKIGEATKSTAYLAQTFHSNQMGLTLD